jgi:hypothetical protein
MKKYILTSARFEGKVTFGYDDDGNIVYYNNEIPDRAVVLWLKRFLPLDRQELDIIKAKIHATITEVPEDLTFERFWNSYDKKINKKRAYPLFKKLSDAEKMQAIIGVKAYKAYCSQTGRFVADPDRYLRDRFFETEWGKVKL